MSRVVGSGAHERALIIDGIGPPAVIVKGRPGGIVPPGTPDSHRSDDGGQAEDCFAHRDVVADPQRGRTASRPTAAAGGTDATTRG